MSEIRIKFDIRDEICDPAWPKRTLDYKIYYGQIYQLDCYPPLDKRFASWLISVQKFFQTESNGWIYNSGQYGISSMSLDKAYEKIISEGKEKLKLLDELLTDYIRFNALLKLEKKQRSNESV